MHQRFSNQRIVVAVTGASGACYSRRLLQVLADVGAEIHLVVSPYGWRLLADELGISEQTAAAAAGGGEAGARAAERITLHPYRDVGDKLASGSFLTGGMVICPCSGNTLGEVAAGTGANLISRAAAVHLKEGRRLILLPREMPLSQIEMENMLRISRAGGIICPASPGFYMLPKKIDDLVDFVVGKVCDLLGAPHQLNTRWDPKSIGQTSE